MAEQMQEQENSTVEVEQPVETPTETQEQADQPVETTQEDNLNSNIQEQLNQLREELEAQKAQKAELEKIKKEMEAQLREKEFNLSKIAVQKSIEDTLKAKELPTELRGLINPEQFIGKEENIEAEIDKIGNLFNNALSVKVEAMKQQLLKGQAPIVPQVKQPTKYEQAKQVGNIRNMLASKLNINN